MHSMEGNDDIKYIFTLSNITGFINQEVKNNIFTDTVISDLFDENLTEIDFIISLSELELIYGFEIPEELYDRTNLTLGEFAEELWQLPIISDDLYPEFYDIKLDR